jgi:hypothetical protein
MKVEAWSSPTICSVLGFHLIARPRRAAMAAKWQVFIVCTWL